MEKVLSVDAALAILTKAKKQMGGDACLILSLSGSGIMDCNINNMVIQNDGENRYVEVRARHPELAEKS
jgi:hypothetical protein